MNTTSVPTSVKANPVVHLGFPRVRIGGAIPADRPRVPELIDRYGRIARDLRVSLTDKCNLRCRYCMPAEGIQPVPGERILTDDEVVRLVRIAVERLGVREVRFTGGEPLLRKGLEKIVAATSALATDLGTPVETSLTTNALGLRHRARRLKEAGMARVNISMDTTDREAYAALTTRLRELAPRLRRVCCRSRSMPCFCGASTICTRCGYWHRRSETGTSCASLSRCL